MSRHIERSFGSYGETLIRSWCGFQGIRVCIEREGGDGTVLVGVVPRNADFEQIRRGFHVLKVPTP